PGVNSTDPSTVTQGLREKELQGRIYSQAELEQGAVLKAAVFLKDQTQSRKTMPELEKAAEHGGMAIKAVSWQQASGTIGQLVLLFWAIFVVASIIIAFVALIIINNELLTATM